MTHRIAVPPMRLPMRHRLSYRQARTAVLLGLCMGVLLGMAEVTFDLYRERQRIRANITQMLGIIRESAAQATHHQDSVQAEKVLSGLFQCQGVHQAHLRTPTGMPFHDKKRTRPSTGMTRWVASRLLDEDFTITIPLTFNDQPAGELTIAVDAYVSAEDFMLRAGFTLLSSLLQAFLLASILTITFHRLLTRPILLIGRQLASVDPAEPARQPIAVPSKHHEDELGLLARFINQALALFENALQVHKETDHLLKRTQFSVDHAADMICWVEPGGRFIYVNEAMCQAVEYSREELLTMTVVDVHVDWSSDLWEDHCDDLEKSRIRCMETAVRTKSGAILHLEVQTTLLSMDGDTIHCHFARDIRPRKLAERAIRRANRTLLTLSHGNETMIKATSEQELLKRICRLIVEQGGYRMAWVGFAAVDGRIVPAAQYGFDDDYLDTLEITWDDTEKGRGPTGTAFRTGKPILAREIQSDPNFAPWRREASRRGYVSSLALPLPVDDLLPLGTLNIYSSASDSFDSEEIQLLENLANNLAFGILKFREAEERRRAQRAMQISEEKLRTLFHHSPDLLMTLDRNGAVQYCNRLLPQFPAYLFPGARLSALRERLDEVFVTGQAVEFPFTDGDSAWWEARLAPIFHDGKVSEVLAVCRDVTEKHTLQAQNLRNARLASLGVLSASVAHEVNNPNNAIQFNVPILAAIWGDARPILQHAHERSGAFYLGGMALDEAMEVVPRLLDGIRMSSQRIQTIIAGLKQMARQDKRLLAHKVMIHDPIQSAMLILQSQIRAATDHCIFTPAPTPLMIRGNAQQLEQAFINIIQNALHALDNRCQRVDIAVLGESDHTHLQVIIRDQGCGIPPEHLSKLTDPFFSTKSESGGMGLGLSITRTIIENHAGTLSFDSQPDRGTTVTVRLPLYVDTLRGDVG
ncbi:MAG: PAS domain S-box protein [Magnetococcales bacterium]|nr:PAS domain S-box protein [Magnetococcales bacterium]NGZ04926.1 PAS domain S-box protein [Magnetococcales bacterium]